MTGAHIEITSGIMQGPARVECGKIVSLDFAGVGKLVFIVEEVGADGGRLVLHDGFSHVAAVTAATEDSLPIHDLTGEGG